MHRPDLEVVISLVIGKRKIVQVGGYVAIVVFVIA